MRSELEMEMLREGMYKGKKPTYKQHQSKHVSLNEGDFYNEYVKDYVLGWVSFLYYDDYVKIIRTFFEVAFDEMVKNMRVFLLPYSLGYFHVKEKKVNIRNFEALNYNRVAWMANKKQPVKEREFKRETNFKWYRLIYKPGAMLNQTRFYKYFDNVTSRREINTYVENMQNNPLKANYKTL